MRGRACMHWEPRCAQRPSATARHPGLHSGRPFSCRLLRRQAALTAIMAQVRGARLWCVAQGTRAARGCPGLLVPCCCRRSRPSARACPCTRIAAEPLHKACCAQRGRSHGPPAPAPAPLPLAARCWRPPRRRSGRLCPPRRAACLCLTRCTRAWARATTCCWAGGARARAAATSALIVVQVPHAPRCFTWHAWH